MSSNLATPKRYERRDHPLARAVFTSVYNSRAQHGLRAVALLLLTLKHVVRGLAFSWPVYLLALAGLYAAGWPRLLLWSLAVPGIGLSLFILLRGVREEYQSGVAGRLLGRARLLQLLKGRAP
jgi:hypothetical protein